MSEQTVNATVVLAVQDLPREIAKRVAVDEQSGCWLWRGKTKNGYPMAVSQGSPHRGRVHRIVWRLFVGPIKQGNVLHHTCHNKRCVNPKHMVSMSGSEHSRAHWLEQQYDLADDKA